MTQSELLAALDYEIFELETRIERISNKLQELNKEVQTHKVDEDKNAVDLRILLCLQLNSMREFVKVLKIRKQYTEGKPIDWTELYIKGN